MTPIPEPPDPDARPDPDEEINALLEGNRRWADARDREDPETFPALARTHRPPFLFVGCCDARKPLNMLTGASPGHLFIHRNVANQVRLDDPAIAASLEFALGALEVRHLIVCGHSRCGGVQAALAPEVTPAVGRWISPVRDLAREIAGVLEEEGSAAGRADLLARRNVVRQLENLLELDAVRETIADPARVLRLHGWFFRLETGRVEVLELPMERWREGGLWPLPGSGE